MKAETAPVSRAPADSAAPHDVERIRADFPILQREVNGKTLAYLDNAATAQKPAAVIDAVSEYYRHSNANIHRCDYRPGARLRAN